MRRAKILGESVSTARKLPFEVFVVASEVAGMDQLMADARAEWDMEKARLRQKVKQDAGSRV